MKVVGEKKTASDADCFESAKLVVETKERAQLSSLESRTQRSGWMKGCAWMCFHSLSSGKSAFLRSAVGCCCLRFVRLTALTLVALANDCMLLVSESDAVTHSATA